MDRAPHDAKRGHTMRIRTVGKTNVSAVGLSAMGFSHGYGPGTPADEAIDLVRKAFELGCTTADVHGCPTGVRLSRSGRNWAR
jgi:hypothetical protein